MNKKALVEKILGLTRAQKEFFVNNFDKIESILSKEATFRSFIKKAQGEADFDSQILNILVAGLEDNPQGMQVVQSYLQSNDQSKEEVGSVLREAFLSGLSVAEIDPSYQEFYTSYFDQMISNETYFFKQLASFLPEIVPSESQKEIQEKNIDEVPEEDIQEASEEEVSRKFSDMFSVDPSEINIVKGKYGTQYAIYRGVLNVPVDKKGDVILSDEDVAFFKKTIDGYMSFFEAGENEEPYAPDSGLSYSPGEEGIDEKVRGLKTASDPLTRRYKEFFQMKSEHFDEEVRTNLITREFEGRILQVYNELTGSNEKSYKSIISKYKAGELPVSFNDLNRIASAVRKRVFGQPLSSNDLQVLGSHAERSKEDMELHKKTMGLRAADDLANDYIGKMQKLYIGEKIGQETHDRVMELGELAYGSSLAFDGPAAKNGYSLAQIITGEAPVTGLIMPKSMRSKYVDREKLYVSDEELPPEAQGSYQNDIVSKIEEVKKAFSANGIEDLETIRAYMDSLYSPDSYSYYKHTAETTRHYQLQNEFSRLKAMGNKPSNSFWCSKCGRFRPQPRKDTTTYIKYKDDNGEIRTTFNIAPTEGRDGKFKRFRQKEITDSGVEVISGLSIDGNEEFFGDNPVTEYERTLLSPEAQEILSNRCEFFSFGECDVANNFYPNLVNESQQIDINSLSYMGFAPLRLFGEPVEKISPEELGGFANKTNVTEDRKAYFPSNYEEIITRLNDRIVSSFGDQATPEVIDQIRRDLINTIKLVATDSEIMSEKAIREDPENPLNEYYDSASMVLDYINHTIRNNPEKRAKVEELFQQISSSQNGQWVTEESLYNLESLREWMSLFGFDSYSKSSLRRMNSNVDIAAVEGKLREKAGIEDVGIHSLLLNNNITDVPVNDIALMSSSRFIQSNESAQRLIRNLVISRFMPELDASGIGRMYPNEDPDEAVVQRDDSEILNRIFEELKVQPIRIPKPDIIFSEVYNQQYPKTGKEKKNDQARVKDINERYERFLYEYDPNDYDDWEMADIELYFYDVPLDEVAPYIFELIKEYRKLNRNISSFNQPLEGIDPRKNWGIQTSPSKRRVLHANKLAMPWVSYNEDPRDAMGEVPREPVPVYSNISWFAKKYAEAAAANPSPDSVAQVYAQAGIEGKEVTDPILDLALLNATNLENSRIVFEKEPESVGIKKELEIELMRQSLREECRYIYLDSHKGGGSSKAKGIGSYEDDVSMVMIAATIMGKDPKNYIGSGGDDYDEIRKSSTYELVKNLIQSPKETMESNIAKIAGGEVPVQFEPAFNPQMTIQDKLQYRDQHRRYKGLGKKSDSPDEYLKNSPHLTALHDSLIKYLISPDKIAHNILLDLSGTGAYLEEPTRVLISQLVVRALQGPSAKSMFADRPYETTAAYHMKNASSGYFEPAQQENSFFVHSTSGSPSLMTTLLGDREANWIVGDVYQVADASGFRRNYGRQFTNDRSMEMSSTKRKMLELMRAQQRANKRAYKDQKWYKKSQTMVKSENPNKFKIEDVLFFSDRDLVNAIRNIGYRSGGDSPIRPTLPKMFLRPFSDFKSIASIKNYAKKSGLKAVPVTPEAKELIQKMGLRLS